jgi:hypothetical protein
VNSVVGKARAVILIAGAIAVVSAIGGVAFIGSGVYNIGADDHHTKIALVFIEQLRDHSIESTLSRSSEWNSPVVK